MGLQQPEHLAAQDYVAAARPVNKRDPLVGEMVFDRFQK
jgi:hypothetical protein